ncbi:ankyrin repeat-containing domain protein [Amylostereum chailletii]|nr:ankyrin repeat-containing domain protein [Amylostereum chailletii]
MNPHPPNIPADLWQSALEAYEDRTGTDLKTEDVFGDLDACDSVDGVLSVVDEQMSVFKKFRATDPRWEKLRSVLKPVVHVVFSFSEATGEGVSLAVPAGKTIFAAIGVLLAATKGVSASYDALVDLFDVLKAFLNRLKIRGDLQLKTESKQILVKILVQLLAVLALATKLIKKKRLGQYVSILTGNQDVKDAVGKLDKLTAEDLGMVATETFVNTYEIFQGVKALMADNEASARHLEDILTSIGKLIKSVSSLEKHAQDAASSLNSIKELHVDEKVERWLKPPNPSINHNAACDLHHPGTGDWFLRGDVFKEWKIKESSLLWIHGKPGSGKSILRCTYFLVALSSWLGLVTSTDTLAFTSSVIIEALKPSVDTRDPPHPVYFYFDFRDSHKHEYRGMLSSLAFQLAHMSSEANTLLRDLYSRNHTGTVEPSIAELNKCVRHMFSVCGEVFVILDALDECPMHTERTKVLDMVQNIVSWKLRGLRLCITSRPETDIKMRLELLDPVQINLHSVDQQAEDIHLYVCFELTRGLVSRTWPSNLLDLAIKTLSEKANGMFRWVFCQLEVLRDCLPMDVQRTVKDLPMTLDGTYQRILESIPKVSSQHALHVLQCLSFSWQPLTIQELADILAVDFNSGCIPQFIDSYRPPPLEVLRICSSLVVLNDSVVQFAHFSVQEYLVSKRLCHTAHAKYYHLDATLSHITITQLCLSMLVQNNVETNFLQYAAKYWVIHAQYENVAKNDKVHIMMEMLFSPKVSFLSKWLAIHDPAPWHFKSSNLPPNFSCLPILYTSLFGFYEQTQILWKACDTSTSANMENQIVLRAAAWGGNPQIVSLLLEHNLDVNIQAGKQGTALLAAAYRGHLVVVDLLLKHNADMHIQSGEIDSIGYDTPLQVAAFGGHLSVVNLLLKHGAGVNIQANLCGTALQAAAFEGHLAVVGLLLKHNADVNIKSVIHGTALQAAAYRGHLAILSLLLKHNADVNIQAGLYCGTALQAAAWRGNLAVVSLLLKHNADVNIQVAGGLHGTALQACAHRGYLEVVNLLLEHNADVNIQAGVHGTALQAAAAMGNLAVVNLLLKYSADVNIKAGTNGTALQVAAYAGHLEVVDFLLKHGADMNIQGGKYGTALQAATRQDIADSLKDKCKKIALLLVEQGAVLHCEASAKTDEEL